MSPRSNGGFLITIFAATMTRTEKPSLEVCLSPALLHLYDTKGAIVVIIDIFRATSTITAALHNGAESVIPVASVSDCIAIGASLPNSLTAGERDGKVAEGLQHGNSPLEYPTSFVSGKTLVLTTTNGTRLLHMVQDAAEIVIGSFLNLSVLCEYLLKQDKNILLGCASWKDKFNLEDTLFAGAVVHRLQHAFEVNCDAARGARHLYNCSGGDHFIEFLKDSSHYRRLSAFGLERDMEYCVTADLHPVVPRLQGDRIVAI
ncbi:2-phosphosulfolactate phosphatase family protein [Nemorincola caseinilytica]|uniref:Probable 2-phosphosulfolactate phosphatase n=2 Tax=Nemorincola caseinilytica TaxID=2054315 RepID=A0ABP8N643_9BACT